MAVERCPINDGDFAVVRQTATAKNGDIPTRHFLRLPIGGKVTSLAPAAATSACGLSLSRLLGRLLDIENPIFHDVSGRSPFLLAAVLRVPDRYGCRSETAPCDSPSTCRAGRVGCAGSSIGSQKNGPFASVLRPCDRHGCRIPSVAGIT